MSAPGSWRRSPGLHAGAVGAIAAAVLLQYGLYEFPIQGDRAHFVYLGQTVLRGDPLYPIVGYPPLAPLLAAATMWVGGWLDLPTYLAPRHLGVLVGALSAAALCLVVRRATASAWAGLLAGLLLAGFAQLGAASISNLEPKGLVILFTLAACLALQRRRWLGAGAAGALAASCFQPALLAVPASLGVIASARPRPRAWLRYAAGLLVGALPAGIYLAAADALGDFWRVGVVELAASEGASAGTRPLRALEVAARHAANELGFFATAALGLAWSVARALRRGPRRGIRSCMQPRMAGVPALTLLWGGFALVEFDGAPDLLPLLPLVAFWAAWGVHQLVALLVSQRHRLGWRGSHTALRAVLASTALALTAAYGFADALLFRPAMTLSEQEQLVRAIFETAGPDGTVVGFNVPDVYVIGQRASPIHPRAVWVRHRTTPQACRRLIEDALGPGPEVAVLLRSARGRLGGRCPRQIHDALRRAGYRSREVEIPFRDLSSFVPHPRDVWTVSWLVYAQRRNSR